MVRTFVAFPLPDNWKEPLLSISNKNVPDEKVRWTSSENLHITLFFIGEIEEINLEKISSALRNILIGQKAFSLEFETVEMKGKRSKPFDTAQGKPFDTAQGKPFDTAQGKPFDSVQGKPFDNAQGKPSMVWVRFRKSESFAMLAEKIYQAVKEFMTIEVNHKDPIPHCTLARIKSGADVSKLDLSFLPPEREILVDHGELWRTVQGKDRVRYERVEVYT